jgi:hypothetical protein
MPASKAQLQKQIPNRTNEHFVCLAMADDLCCGVATIILYVMLMDQKEQMMFSWL